MIRQISIPERQGCQVRNHYKGYLEFVLKQVMHFIDCFIDCVGMASSDNET